ncbi:hypothetical protein [Accumulibacter sp.]|uniref:hypothetical protein n=1 Tax=Accumulibacter sp. TaxID=2053492 RepID=UPI001AC7951A|nr:hypothetical protein [Accumulibacter sp.]MBN8499291.1 hypothetical protein [Accumulibacter sp.]
MPYHALIAASTLALLSGCATFRGSEPIHPPAGDPRHPALVAELRPEFRWRPPVGKEFTYDLIVLRATKWSSGPRTDCESDDESGAEGTRGSRPTRWPSLPLEQAAYFRAGLREATHRIDVDLAPDTSYLWSVRTRQGDRVSGWACYDYRTLTRPVAFGDPVVRPAGFGLQLQLPITAVFPKEANSFFVFRTPNHERLVGDSRGK